MANLSYKFHPNHNLGIKFLYNHSGESLARYQVGPLPRDLPPGTLFETRVLQYTERELRSFQLDGAHHNFRAGWCAPRVAFRTEPFPAK
ncbi:MAG: hypothetical protein ACE5I1_09550 [bacterium]